MARLIKRDAPPEVAIQKIEALMRELGISIESNTPIYLNYDETKIAVIDSESHENIQVLPRHIDTERLALWG